MLFNEVYEKMQKLEIDTVETESSTVDTPKNEEPIEEAIQKENTEEETLVKSSGADHKVTEIKAEDESTGIYARDLTVLKPPQDSLPLSDQSAFMLLTIS